MMQPGIQALGAIMFEQAAATQSGTAAPLGTTSFLDVMQRQLDTVESDFVAAEGAVRDLAQGKPVELHDVMISLERARLSVQTFVQVRNKLIESYQDVMRMQL